MKTKILLCFVALSVLFANCKKEQNGVDDIPTGYTTTNLTQVQDLVLGNSTNNDDELVGSMVTDAQGNIYVTMNITDASVNRSIILAKISPNGTLVWAKLLDSGKEELSPDSGENAETGGTAGSIDIDNSGNVYVVGKGGAVSGSSFNNLIIIKINGNDGSLIAAKKWRKNWSELGSAETQGYAIDVEGDYVYVVGFTGENKVPVLCLNRQTMDLVFQYELDITQGTVTRGYAVRANASGNLFIAGVDGSKTYLAKINNANTQSPTLEFVKYFSLPFAARINSMELDNTGIYYSADVRGVNTDFVALKTDFNGQSLWGISYKNADNDRNNTHVVKVVGDNVYVGGRIGLKELDVQQGDGLILCLNKSNGEFKWANILYTGTKNDEVCEHRVKGIAVDANGNIIAVGQVYGGNDNKEHFNGVWIQNKDLKTTAYNINLSQATGTFTEVTATNAGLRDIDGFSANNYSITLQQAKDKKTNFPPDCDAFINIFKMK